VPGLLAGQALPCFAAQLSFYSRVKVHLRIPPKNVFTGVVRHDKRKAKDRLRSWVLSSPAAGKK
jgi:hypothetical protein